MTPTFFIIIYAWAAGMVIALQYTFWIKYHRDSSERPFDSAITWKEGGYAFKLISAEHTRELTTCVRCSKRQRADYHRSR